jgi:hypothetical protein
MIKDFKFFRPSETRINWQLTGLLDGATNVPLLTGVLDITYKYIEDYELMFNDTVKHMLLIIMTRLYRDKYNSYSDYDIRVKIDEIMVTMNTPSTRTIVQEIRENAWTSIDVEAEINNIIYEQCKWNEDMVGEVFHTNADTTLTFRRND